MIEPVWISEARKHIGLRELPGAPTAPRIATWLDALGAWWRDDATPWCGVYCAAVMQACGMAVPKHWYRAKGWLDWGMRIEEPDVGCIVVFERQGGGHVGFVVGRDRANNLLVLGGNQGDAVSIAAFNRDRVAGFRWPLEVELASATLPLGSAAATTGEA